ncbi:MAG TPA: hypothetical protein VEY88_22925, partial [Archangium sp.]|nr:hypothetical protein [Archangium sp.]
MALLALGGVGCQETEPAGTAGATSRQGTGALGAEGARTELTREGQEVVSGELLVRFKTGTGQASILQTHALVGAQLRHTFQSVDGLQLVSVPEGRSLEELVEAYRADPDVAYAEPNFIYRTQTLPDDPELE